MDDVAVGEDEAVGGDEEAGAAAAGVGGSAFGRFLGDPDVDNRRADLFDGADDALGIGVEEGPVVVGDGLADGFALLGGPGRRIRDGVG